MIAKEREHNCLRLRLNNSTIDKYKWVCLNNVAARKQKRVKLYFTGEVGEEVEGGEE